MNAVFTTGRVRYRTCLSPLDDRKNQGSLYVPDEEVAMRNRTLSIVLGFALLSCSGLITAQPLPASGDLEITMLPECESCDARQP